MKDNTQKPSGLHCGMMREDGKQFLHYYRKKGRWYEGWVSQEAFAKIRQKHADYMLDYYKARRDKKRGDTQSRKIMRVEVRSHMRVVMTKKIKDLLMAGKSLDMIQALCGVGLRSVLAAQAELKREAFGVKARHET